MMRIGQGYDIHRFSTDLSRPLILGGITLEGPGLEGHSDADVLTHAICDALLGALGLGDLGSHFSDTDEKVAGISSTTMLDAIMEMVAKNGYKVVNVDATVICERPKLAPHRAAMCTALSATCDAPVSVKATTNEELGPVGRREGICALAIVLLTTNEEEH